MANPHVSLARHVVDADQGHELKLPINKVCELEMKLRCWMSCCQFVEQCCPYIANKGCCASEIKLLFEVSMVSSVESYCS
jgi:hypothetical protein